MGFFSIVGLTLCIIAIGLLIYYEFRPAQRDQRQVGNQRRAPDGYSVMGIALGFVLGGIIFWHWAISANTGLPIPKFKDGDVFKIVGNSKTADDLTSVLSMRRINCKAGHWVAQDMDLRTYRVPSHIVDILKGKDLPVYVRVSRMGDVTGIKIIDEFEAKRTDLQD